MKKEGLYYRTMSAGNIQCLLCPHYCLIPPGKSGFCGIRKNSRNKLVTINYALISSLALDPIEKKPLYEFYPGVKILSLGTIGCNLKCLHCQNYSISQEYNTQQSSFKKITPRDLGYLVGEQGHAFVAFTYNEPFIWYEYILESAKILKKMGVKTVLVTNGYVNRAPLEEILPFIDAFSLDLKWSKNKTAQRLSGITNVTPIYESAKIIFKAEKHLEITTNLVDGYNDSDDELKTIAKFISQELSNEIPWHLSRSFPAYQLTALSPTPIKTIEKALDIGKKAGLKKIYTSNI